jgi:hypothetical protein
MPDDFTKSDVKLWISQLRIEIFKVLEGIAGATVGTKAFHDAVGKLPPMPEKDKRKFKGFKDDIRARVDRELYKCLKADAGVQSGGNISAQLDKILWNHYGQIKLSFEVKNEKK